MAHSPLLRFHFLSFGSLCAPDLQCLGRGGSRGGLLLVAGLTVKCGSQLLRECWEAQPGERGLFPFLLWCQNSASHLACFRQERSPCLSPQGVECPGHGDGSTGQPQAVSLCMLLGSAVILPVRADMLGFVVTSYSRWPFVTDFCPWCSIFKLSHGS